MKSKVQFETEYRVRHFYRVVFLLCYLLIQGLVSAFAQAPNWDWARADSVASGQKICVDAFGNSYVTGFFHYTATFGSITLTCNANSGNSNLFLVKYNPWGTVVWAQNAGGHSSNEGEAVAVDDSGNVFLTGYFTDTILFGSTYLIAQNNYSPAFITKFNPQGSIVWAKMLGTGTGIGHTTTPHSIALDQLENIFLTGYFQAPSATFGSITLNSPDNGISSDVFIAKCDPVGNVLWAKMAGSTSQCTSNSIATDGNGNSIITGWYSSSTLSFGSNSITNNSSSGYNSFVTKYNSSGNVVWAKNIGGDFSEISHSISTDITGNIIVVGEFWCYSLVIASDTLMNASQTTHCPDVFLVKFDPTGNVVWAKSAGGNDWDIANSVAIDNSGNCYVAGYFTNVITFGSTSLTCNGGQDIFIVKYDALGNEVWAMSQGDSFYEEANSIDVNPAGDCYITGYFGSQNLTFGSFTITNSYFPGQAMFVARTGEEAGIHSFENANGAVRVYPNPSSGVFQFELLSASNSSMQNHETQIEIYDAVGELVFKSVFTGPRMRIDLSGNAKGIYFYRVNSEECTGSGKLIVE